MLLICVDCRRIVSCLNSKGEILGNCCSCKVYDECYNSTPMNILVERRVKFIKFVNSCFDHENPKIGFKQNSKET